MSDRLRRESHSIELAGIEHPFPLELGGALPLRVAYETYGTLDATRSNAVLVCHALTGSAHAAGVDELGRKGWWDGLIGPGRGIDTDRYFVICSNVLGGCYGTTGPTSIDPSTGKPYGENFPAITIGDMVHAQRLLLDALEIERLHLVIGGSMGGMQVLEWCLRYGDRIDLIAPIATSARHSPWSVGFNAIAREAIALGVSAGDPTQGLRLARKVAMMSYRSDREFAGRFAPAGFPDDEMGDEGSEVERYLNHHATSLVARFDADTYRTISRAMDLHDLARDRGDDLELVLASIRQPALCVGISSDILYPAHEQQSIARSIPGGHYMEVDSLCGHDAFLIEYDQLNALVSGFLNRELC